MVRYLRRRWVLALIFGLSLLYFIYNVFWGSPSSYLSDFELGGQRIGARRTFVWQPKFEPEVSLNNDTDKTRICRNTVQGRVHIADHKGFVCPREDLESVSGCCKPGNNTLQFACVNCTREGCCGLYEHCVSCCLNPTNTPALKQAVSKAADSLLTIFSSAQDQFELCMAKCRTSSQSVQHENTYRDPKYKYCYGPAIPDVKAVLRR